MKLKILHLLIIFNFISFRLHSQVNDSKCDSHTLKNEALKLFDKYAPKIEQSNDLKIQYRRTICGDLNNDKLTDVIVEFGLGVKNSNGILLKQAAIYLNVNGKLKVVSGFDPNYCFKILRIENGIIKIQGYETCASFAKETEFKEYVLLNNKLTEKK